MTVDREWEKFNGGPNQPKRDRIHITMNAKSVIFLNANTHRMLGRPEAVQLFFNCGKEKIGVKPAHARLPDAFPVKEKSGSYVIHASPFCGHYGIKLLATEKFVLPDIDNNGMLQLDLKTTVTIKHQRRSRKPRA